ncbi:carbon-nitrogen hydrolase family protein [Pseudonocardia sp. KRD291]|uniref:carbon-nitrogen hydrolase family protein n=1 Tax=Pseudonocardia sp. KRD291 TaxID=2792007 RepID=UPI001C4A64E4|nr:carbon-nitrogen hydrolase family protein [Pseudonocardia sp. KRD291]MBW0101514.1 carbon-nitrogen hydrolase family protein [Pseudonocardia sp. KRD291]
MRNPLTIAAAQPWCRPGEIAKNTRAHAALVRQAASRVVVFPELSLTGYDLAARPLSPEDPVLEPLQEACAETGALALVGAVTRQADRRYIAALAIEPDTITVAYRKTWLGGNEAEHFARGDGPTALAVDGWRLGLGICKDTGSAQHTAGTAALDIDAYVAGVVHRPDELAEQEARATVIARSCQAYTAIASAAGAVGENYPDTCGASAIWGPNGLAITRAGREPNDIARATLFQFSTHPHSPTRGQI